MMPTMMKLYVHVTAWIALAVVPSALAHPPHYFGGEDNSPYIDWVANDLMVGNSSRYPHSFFLSSGSDESLGVAVHYHLDVESKFLHLALAARAEGWFSFGHSENGGMLGSDILIYEAKNPDKVLDAYILDSRQPILDDCPSHWILKSAKVAAFEDGFLMIEVSRAFDTGDMQDHRIFNDTDGMVAPHLLIAAWGDEPSYGYHGLVNRARGSIRWFDDSPGMEETFSTTMENLGVYSFFEIGAKDHPVPTIETEYAHFCVDFDDLIAMGVPPDVESMSMVGFEPFVDPRAAKHVQ
jgi:DOMON domain